MTILHLNLKACWYDLIEKGIKTEEYREIKPFWIKRLMRYYLHHGNTCEWVEDFEIFDAVKFSYGYTKRTMTFKCEGISIGEGKPEWGAVEGQKYVVIKIGERIA